MNRDPFDYEAPAIDDETLKRRVPLADRSAAAPAASPASATGAPPDLKQLVVFAGQHFGVDPNVLAGMVMKESMLQGDVMSGQRKSTAGAVGVAQFMPDTAKRYGIDPTDPTQSVLGMAAYLRDNLARFNGDYKRAVAGYNWGENRKALDADDWERSAPAETRDYVDFVTKFAESMGSEKRGTGARRELPDGVKPSAAGAGRGVVNPPLVDSELGVVDTLQNSLARGVPSLLQGASGTALRANAGIVGAIDSVEKKMAAGQKKFVGDEDPYSVALMTPEQRLKFRDQVMQSACGNAASIAAAEGTKAQYPLPGVAHGHILSSRNFERRGSPASWPDMRAR